MSDALPRSSESLGDLRDLAPMSPLSDAKVKAIAAAIVADTSIEPNECYLNRDDSLLLWGEVSRQACDELDRLRKALRFIIEMDPIDNALDPQRAARVAKDALGGPIVG